MREFHIIGNLGFTHPICTCHSSQASALEALSFIGSSNEPEYVHLIEKKYYDELQKDLDSARQEIHKLRCQTVTLKEIMLDKVIK